MKALEYVHAAREFLHEHPGFTAVVVWPVLSAAITLLFNPRTREERDELRKSRPILGALVQFTSGFGVDASQLIDLMKRVTSRDK